MAKEDIAGEARERLRLADEADYDDRENADADLKFYDGDQWPDDILAQRTKNNRPCLTINKLPEKVDQVVGEQRQNRPTIKVRPVDSVSDPYTAEILQGIIRSIESNSQANIAYDNAFESATICGRGFFRIITDYSDDDVFEQDILIRPIFNPFTVFWDPNAKEIDLSDAQYMFITDWVSKDVFEKRFPGKDLASFESEGKQDWHQDWVKGKSIRIAEYWRKKINEKTIYLLDNGQTVEEIPEGMTAVKTRKVDSFEIEHYLISGVEVLEGPDEWPIDLFPIIPVWGKELTIDGKKRRRGLVRYAKDPCRMYNYWRSTETEVVALAPKAPWILTPEQIAGHENMWKEAHRENYPYLLANADKNAPGWPQRNFPTQLSSAYANNAGISNEEIQSTTGLYAASVGDKSNEKSGKAIIERKRQGNTGTFAYIGNLSRALIFAGKVLIKLIPKTYDTPRVLRVIGEDDKPKFAPINMQADEQGEPWRHPQTGAELITEDGKPWVLNDITIGKYDVTVTVGPSYATQRLEAADNMMMLLQSVPDIGKFIFDLVVKNMDWPGAEEISRRLEKLLPPGLLEDGEGGPPQQQGQEGGGQPPPDPQQQIDIEKGKMQIAKEQLTVEKAKIQLAQEQEKLVGVKLDNRRKIAQIDGNA